MLGSVGGSAGKIIYLAQPLMTDRENVTILCVLWRQSRHRCADSESLSIAFQRALSVTEICRCASALDIADLDISYRQFLLQRGIIACLLRESVQIFQRIFDQSLSHRSGTWKGSDCIVVIKQHRVG